MTIFDLNSYNKLLITLLSFFINNNFLLAQNTFNFGFKTGLIVPRIIFYNGSPSSSTDLRIEFKNELGYLSSLLSNVQLNQKNKIGIYIDYESYDISIREYGTFEDDIFTMQKSYLHSQFNARNIGLGMNLGHNFNKLLCLNAGLQYNMPINQHNGYVYSGAMNKVIINYDYKTLKQLQINTSLDFNFFSSKKLDLIISPGISFFLNKDQPTYVTLNQIRKYYFSLSLGINFKS